MVEEKKDNKSNNIHNNNQVDHNSNSTNESPPLRKLTLKKLDNRSFDSTIKGVYSVDESEKESGSVIESIKDSTKDDLKEFSSEDSNIFSGRSSENFVDKHLKDSFKEDLGNRMEEDSRHVTDKDSRQVNFLNKENSTNITNSSLNKGSVSVTSFKQEETSPLIAQDVNQLKVENQAKEGGFSREKSDLDSTEDLVALSSKQSTAGTESSKLHPMREQDQNIESQNQENEKAENWNAESQNAQYQNAKKVGEQKDNTKHGSILASKAESAKEENIQELSQLSKHLNSSNLAQIQQNLQNAFKGLPSNNNLRNTLAVKKDSLQGFQAGNYLSSKEQGSKPQDGGSLHIKNQEFASLKEENSSESSNFESNNVVDSIKGDKSYDSMEQDKFYENEKLLDEEFLSNHQLQNDLGDTDLAKSLKQEESIDDKDKSEINGLKISAKATEIDSKKSEAFGTSENFGASFSQELKQNIEDGVLQNIIPDVHIQNVKEEETPENSWDNEAKESLSKQESTVQIKEVKSIEALGENIRVNEVIGNDSSTRNLAKKSAEESEIVVEEAKNAFISSNSVKQPEENNINQQVVIEEKSKAVLGQIIPKKIAVNKNDSEIEKFRDQLVNSNESNVNANSQSSKKNNSRELNTSKYSEKEIAAINKIDKVLGSVALLFKPFKEILRKTLPFLNPVLNALDKFGLFIATIVRFIAYKSPVVIRFIKGRIFKAIIIVVIFCFLFGILASRLINSKEYITALENSIYDKTGYKVAINGVIKVNIIPSFGIGIKNVVVLKNQNFESDFALSQLSAEQINITFKILPIIFGNFEIDKIYLHQAVIDINIKNSTNNKDILNYEKTIKDINKVSAFKVVKKTENTPTENLNGNLLQQLDNIIGSKEQVEEDNELLNDVIIGEDTSATKKDSSVGTSGGNNNLNALKSSNKDSTGENLATQKTDDLPNSGDTNSSDKVNSNSNQEDRNSMEQGAMLNDVIETNTNDNKGAVYNIFSGIVKNIKFDLQSVDQIRVARSKINIIVGNNKLNSLDNVEGTIKTSFLNKTTSQGSFRFMDINTYYALDLDYLKSNKGVNFDFKLGTDTSINNALEVVGTKLENGNITADVTSNGQVDLLLINKFIIPMDLTKEENHSFKAKLEVTPNTLHLKDISLLFPSVEYSGDLLWNLSNNYSNNACLNLKAKVNSLEGYINSYIKFVKENSSENTLRFSSVLDSINNWKNESVSNFKFNYFKVNFGIEEAKLNNQGVSLRVAAILNNDKIFVENFIIKGETFHLDAMGRVSLDEKNAMFILDSSGELEKTASFLKLPSQTKKFLLNLGKNKEEDKDYSLATKLVINNNKFVFNEFKGHMGDRYFYDTYLVFLERSGSLDLLVKDRVDNLSSDYLSEIYRKQTEGSSNIEDNSVNIFGLGGDFNINVNLVANTFKYKDIELKNAVIDMVLSKSGVRVKKFEASGKYGGSVVASFISDINVMPVVAGHLNLNNFVLKMEETDKLLFKGKNIIGDLYLNGQFRFSGDSYIKPFSNLEGQLTFVKYERIKLNRFANTDGLYMTVSEKKQGNKINYLLNDAYGRLNITNGVVDFYPVVMLYIYGNKEYRGTFEGSYDFFNDSLKVQGSVDNADNINNQMNFKVEGSLLNPDYSRKFTKLARSNVAVRQKEQVTKLDTKSYTIANKINNNKDKNNFNNTYNKNIDKDESYIIDNIYNDTLDRALNSAENEDSFSSKYPIKK